MLVRCSRSSAVGFEWRGRQSTARSVGVVVKWSFTVHVLVPTADGTRTNGVSCVLSASIWRLLVLVRMAVLLIRGWHGVRVCLWRTVTWTP